MRGWIGRKESPKDVYMVRHDLLELKEIFFRKSIVNSVLNHLVDSVFTFCAGRNRQCPKEMHAERDLFPPAL